MEIEDYNKKITITIKFWKGLNESILIAISNNNKWVNLKENRQKWWFLIIIFGYCENDD
jgi:hypothetical protein